MIVGTRGSQLALAQTKQVCADLSNITGESIDVEIIKTKGDKITTSQLYNMDSKGLFTKELDIALLEEEVDFTVHSFKDLPTELDEDLEIVAVPKREAPNEVLISKKDWNELGPGSKLGTSSLRREAFCNHYNKEFELKPIRGNIETRIQKALESDLDATIMAQAGLKRLNLTKYIKNVFPLDYITPPAGQGALAIITRKDSEIKGTISKKVLEELGVGCQWPIGAIARMNDNEFSIYSILLTKEGEILKEQTEKGSIRNAVELGGRIGKLFGDYV